MHAAEKRQEEKGKEVRGHSLGTEAGGSSKKVEKILLNVPSVTSQTLRGRNMKDKADHLCQYPWGK